VICQTISLETGTASADYISLWNGDAKVLIESLDIIQRSATQILSVIFTPSGPGVKPGASTMRVARHFEDAGKRRTGPRHVALHRIDF
jgi:hypothetical protein